MNIKSYKIFCRTAAGLSGYLMLLPFFSFLLSKISPYLTKCAYLSMTGKLCPFCGGTRYIKSIYTDGFSVNALKSPFFIFVLMIVSQLISRILILAFLGKIKNIRRWFVIDMIFHILGIGYIIGYMIWFFAQ